MQTVIYYSADAITWQSYYSVFIVTRRRRRGTIEMTLIRPCVRYSVRPSVRPSVRLAARPRDLVSATPPTSFIGFA